MTRDEAIIVLKNAAWLGSDAERDRAEQAVGIAVEALQADAVPVVRCKNCKHLNDTGMLEYCTFGLPHPNGFCSYGERKDGKDEEHGTD